MGLGEVVDRNGDIHAFYVVVGNPNGPFEIRGRLARRCVLGNRLQALGYVLGATTGIEGKGRLPGLRQGILRVGVADIASPPVVADPIY